MALPTIRSIIRARSYTTIRSRAPWRLTAGATADGPDQTDGPLQGDAGLIGPACPGDHEGHEAVDPVPALAAQGLAVDFVVKRLEAPEGFLRVIYNMGVANELFPLLIFIGIGAMTDFGPLLENPKIFLLGAAGQFGIFLTIGLALLFGFDKLDAVAIGVIGACDGPTAIYVSSRYAPHLLAAVSVAAYSYMSLVPIIQPPIMRFLTTDKERQINMSELTSTTPASKTTKIVFPIVVTIFGGLIAPNGLPLLANCISLSVVDAGRGE